MINKLFKFFNKPKPDLIWLHINNTQYHGVIGWQANDPKTFYPPSGVFTTPVKGEDTFNRKER